MPNIYNPSSGESLNNISESDVLAYFARGFIPRERPNYPGGDPFPYGRSWWEEPNPTRPTDLNLLFEGGLPIATTNPWEPPIEEFPGIDEAFAIEQIQIIPVGGIPEIPTSIPVPVDNPILKFENLEAFQGSGSQGGKSSMVQSMVYIPKIIKAFQGAHVIQVAGRARGASPFGLGFGTSGGNLINIALSTLGVASVIDLVLGMFGPGDDDDILADMITELTASGYIKTPSKRRDGTDSPMNWIHWNIADGDQPFYSPEYISRKFVQSVRKNERTPRYRGRPTPARGRRRSS